MDSCTPAGDGAAAPWRAQLRLDYRREGGATLARHEHRGPLRVLKALHPEGPAVCHHVIVHPPAGIVGGDRLELDLVLGPESHALLTTPGATRYYRSEGASGEQRVNARLGRGARLEWLPGENIVYPRARAVNAQAFHLAEGAQMMGWDLLALGLPAAGAAFDAGWVEQRIEVHDAGSRLWLEAGRLDAAERLLFDSPLGLDGHSVLATMWWARGDGASGADLEASLAVALDQARALGGLDAPFACGASLLNPQLLVWRGLCDRVEPLQRCMRELRGLWRRTLWAMPAVEPRVWAT